MKDVIFLTGVSGAGKSTAMSFMEDIGYYCIDNMPAELISTFMNLMDKSDKQNRNCYRCSLKGRFQCVLRCC